MAEAAIEYRAKLSFNGPATRIAKVMSGLGRLTTQVGSRSMKVVARPTADGDTTLDLRFKGPVSTFEKMAAGLGRLRAGGLMIGTWPTPEKGRIWVLPGIVPPEEWPIPPRRLPRAILAWKPRVRVPTDIAGGIRGPHLHIGRNQVALINRSQFKRLVSESAATSARVLRKKRRR